MWFPTSQSKYLPPPLTIITYVRHASYKSCVTEWIRSHTNVYRIPVRKYIFRYVCTYGGTDLILPSSMYMRHATGGDNARIARQVKSVSWGRQTVIELVEFNGTKKM